MKTILSLFAVGLLAFSPTSDAATIGERAPDFKAVDVLSGDMVTLDSLKGKVVVMEWTNHECPFVRKHYDTNNMQDLQKAAANDGVIWISVVSSAKGKQGHVMDDKAAMIVRDEGAAPTFKFMDADGTIGKAFGAKTTPHMFVLDTDGNVTYMGAIDDNPSPRASSVEGAKNYVKAAWAATLAGTPVEVTETKSYGCSVKY